MAIRVRGLTFTYRSGTPEEVPALRGVDVHVPPGTFCAIIGPVGSGKSTFVQHLNGLLRPQAGEVTVLGTDLARAGREELRALRRRVGLVFQYPEHQLFAETVARDVAFGPEQMGLDDEEVARRVEAALRAVDLPIDIAHRSPFTLSGGQRRRVAIAGVLAMEPDLLILDEPAAGLDPVGRNAVLDLIGAWHATGKTIVLVTHDMEVVAERAERVVVFHEGSVVAVGSPRQVFARADELLQMGLNVPQATRVLLGLRERGLPVETDRLGVVDVANHVLDVLAPSLPPAD